MMVLLCYGLEASVVVRVAIYLMGEQLENVWVGGREEGWEMVEVEGLLTEMEAEGEADKVWMWVGGRLVMTLP